MQGQMKNEIEMKYVVLGSWPFGMKKVCVTFHVVLQNTELWKGSEEGVHSLVNIRKKGTFEPRPSLEMWQTFEVKGRLLNEILNNLDNHFCIIRLICCCCLVAKPCLSDSFVTPWNVARQISSVHGISQTRILEWVAFPSSRGSSRPRDRTQVSCIGRRVLGHWATRETR